jgi:hypothetical protein
MEYKDIETLLHSELEKTEQRPFASRYEAYSVILAEIEGAEEDVERLRRNVEEFWGLVKLDIKPTLTMQGIYKKAVCLTADAIQVGVLALKMLEEKDNVRKIL